MLLRGKALRLQSYIIAIRCYEIRPRTLSSDMTDNIDTAKCHYLLALIEWHGKE